MSTATPEFSRAMKPGLQRSAVAVSGRGRGTQAPGEGFALSIAHREVAKLDFEHGHDRHDVEVAIALVAAKRASLVGRGPQLGDVRVAMALFNLREGVVVDHRLAAPFVGIAHSYAAQRRFVDGVSNEDLVATPLDASH